MTVAPGAPVPSPGAPLGHLVPLYVYPANLPGGRRGADEWDACPAVGPGGLPAVVVANVCDGAADPRPPWAGTSSPGPGAWSVAEAVAPGAPAVGPVDPAYRTAIAGLAARGARVLGYVATGYGMTDLGTPDSGDPTTVLGQVGLWAERYPGVSGVFLDQVPTAGTPAERRAVRAVVDRAPGTVAANAGQLPATDWLLGAGVDLVVYENYVADFLDLVPPAWTTVAGSARLGAVLHDAPGPDAVRAARHAAASMGFGRLYVTDGRQDSGNPYDGLPSAPVWSALVDGP